MSMYPGLRRSPASGPEFDGEHMGETLSGRHTHGRPMSMQNVAGPRRAAAGAPSSSNQSSEGVHAAKGCKEVLERTERAGCYRPSAAGSISDSGVAVMARRGADPPYAASWNP